MRGIFFSTHRVFACDTVYYARADEKNCRDAEKTRLRQTYDGARSGSSWV